MKYLDKFLCLLEKLILILSNTNLAAQYTCLYVNIKKECLVDSIGPMADFITVLRGIDHTRIL